MLLVCNVNGQINLNECIYDDNDNLFVNGLESTIEAKNGYNINVLGEIRVLVIYI